MRNNVCKECGQPLRYKPSLLEKLVKDLVLMMGLALWGILIGSVGILNELWRVAPFAKSKGYKWLRQELCTLFFRVGCKAFELATRLSK